MRPFALLIDDEQNFRSSVASAFELRGIPLDVAPDWKTGLALFQACAHELVIADYNLPNSKNGLLLLVEAKAHRPASKLILISGVLSDTAAGILEGASLVDVYLPKRPKIVDKLLEAAQEAAERAGKPTDWARVAEAYLAGADLDREEIEGIDAALSREMGG
jgi:DNA-binding NtrC family response regulator